MLGRRGVVAGGTEISAHDRARRFVEDWQARTPDDLDRKVLSGRHGLHEAAAFSDAALERLIEQHPREDVQLHQMAGGSGAAAYVDVSVGERSGRDTLRAIERGRMWMSLVHLERAQKEIREVVAELYAELAGRCPGFDPLHPVAHLLVSSPHAEVYFHADAYAGLLWQIRGRKRVFVYPPWDERFLPGAVREACLAGQLVDGPYDRSFDDDAHVFTLAPGDFLGWPQSTPHRVENTPVLNVSLATEHQTALSARRRADASANFWFRKTLGLDFTDVGERSPWAFAKRGAFRAVRGAAKLLGRPLGLPDDESVERFEYVLDPDDPRGFSELAEPRDG